MSGAEDDLVALAGDVYQGLADREIDEIETLALDRRNFFDDMARVLVPLHTRY